MATVVETSSAGLVGDEEVVDLTTPLFFAMIEAGFFPPERRVFLWGGRLCEKMAKTVAHSLTAYAISEKLRPLVTPDWLIWPENPVALDDKHAPLPAVTLVRGPIEIYKRERRHPEARDVGLIVEVAVTSLTIRPDHTGREVCAGPGAELLGRRRQQSPHRGAYRSADHRRRGSYAHVDSRNHGGRDLLGARRREVAGSPWPS